MGCSSATDSMRTSGKLDDKAIFFGLEQKLKQYKLSESKDFEVAFKKHFHYKFPQPDIF